MASQNFLSNDSPDLEFIDVPQDLDLLFYGYDGRQIGKFWFDEDEKQWVFDGDMSESAEMFIDYLIKTLKTKLDEIYSEVT